MDDALEGDGAAHCPAARIPPGATHNTMRAAKTPALPLGPNRIGILRIQCSAAQRYAAVLRHTGKRRLRSWRSPRRIEQPRPRPKKPPKIENARDRSLWRFNLDHSQYNRCCVPQLPQWPPSSFRWRCILWLRRHRTFDLRRRLALRLDRWPTPRLGSVSCPSARPAANLRLASTVPHIRSTFGDPQACAWRSGFIGLRPTSWFHPACAVGPSSGKADDLPPIRIGAVLWLGWRLHPACALCCPYPSAGSASSLHRLLHPPPSPAVNHSACASWLLLRLSL